MNSLIKGRLKKIEEGMVPEGYKKTRVGIIPEDWEFDYLEKLCNIKTGNKDTQDKEDDGKYPFFVRSNNIERINSYAYYGEAILTAGDGVGTGKVFHYINDKFDYHQRVYCLNEFDNINGKYLFYYFSENFIRQVVKYTAKTSVDSVRREMLTKMQIPTPPLQEQEKIAHILSTWDKAIENIEKLIKEKEIQKKGLMQELLTGKTRLPGFSGEWEEVKLGDISKVYSGGTPSSRNSSYYNGGTIPWIRSTDLNKNIINRVDGRITEEGLKNSSAKYIEKGTLLLALYGATAGVVAISNIRGTINQAVLAIIPKTDNKYFLFYYLYHNKKKIVNTYQQGGQPNLSGGIIKSLNILIPPIQEQKAIAEILTTADKEIELLKQLLEAKKEEKKGLMQLLLRGIVRV